VECVIDELRLLQADDVRLALLEPWQQPRHSLLDRVHVPGRYSHGAYGSAAEARRGHTCELALVEKPESLRGRGRQ
jgi:hypothetical protein